MTPPLKATAVAVEIKLFNISVKLQSIKIKILNFLFIGWPVVSARAGTVSACLIMERPWLLILLKSSKILRYNVKKLY